MTNATTAVNKSVECVTQFNDSLQI